MSSSGVDHFVTNLEGDILVWTLFELRSYTGGDESYFSDNVFDFSSHGLPCHSWLNCESSNQRGFEIKASTHEEELVRREAVVRGIKHTIVADEGLPHVSCLLA
jgi:hypothetical protein